MAAVVAAARAAAADLAAVPTAAKDRALQGLAEAIEAGAEDILKANARDVQAAEAQGRRPAFIDRLRLTSARISAMATGVRQVTGLPDPVGAIRDLTRRPNGMLVGRMRVPIGVILMIYEARPSVTVDAAALCLKAGNASILRGGSDATHTLAALAPLVRDLPGLPADAVQVLTPAGREEVEVLLQSSGIDLVIPRGGEELIRTVTRLARMPVLKHFKGVCHLFVDRDADLEMARRIVLNSKAQRPSTCNALETLLVDEAVAARFLPATLQALRQAGVEVRGDDAVQALDPAVVPAADDDWGREFLDFILAVRVVPDLTAALEHIRRYSTGLAEAIVTERLDRAQRFLQAVDSAAVLVNASTRLVDGGEFGLGAEIGISTNRLGPRGPMGVEELTSYKWVVLGSGQVRE